MFEARMQDARLFGEAIAMVAGVAEKLGTFKITQEGIQLVALDPLHTTAVVFNFLAPAFDSYQADEETRIAVDVGSLSRALQRARPNDRVTLGIAERRLTVTCEGSSVRTFDIPALDASNDDIQIPQLDLVAAAEIAADVLADGIKDANLGSPIVTLTLGAQRFRMEAKGDSGGTSLEVKGDGGGLLSAQASEETSARYALSLLEKVVNGAGFAPTAQIRMGRDGLLQMAFGAADRASLSFFLAPIPD